MRLLSKIYLAVAAFAVVTAITGAGPAAQAGSPEDGPWTRIGSYFSRSSCEQDWREKYAKRWKKHLCTQAGWFSAWELYVR